VHKYLISLVFIATVAVAALLTSSTPAAFAQADITVTRQGVENQFPDGLRFYITAESSSPIDEIRVYVRKLGQASRITYRQVEFEPGDSVSGEALFKSKTANEYIPTGTRLSYHFEIRAQDGSVMETQPQTVVYLNSGLDWQTTTSGFINVYYYRHNDRSEGSANAVLSVAADTYSFMAPILGVELTQPMSIVVYSDYRHMLEALQPASRVASQQLRTLGKAFPNERTLLVDGSLNNILSTAAHEFTHLLVADSAGSSYSGVDAWLNEGLAVYSERNPDNEFGRYLSDAIMTDSVPPLASLRTYAGTPRETLRNYGQGFAIVSYLLDTYGASTMSEFFASIATVRTTDNALQAAYGLSIEELDNEWRESVGLLPRALATESLPPLQLLPTRRGASNSSANPAPPLIPAQLSPTDQPAAGPSDAAAAPDIEAQPPLTPGPAPQGIEPQESASPPAAGCYAPASANSAPAAPELTSIALLTFPAGLLGLIAVRRRRR
jgi:hypothetical protein